MTDVARKVLQEALTLCEDERLKVANALFESVGKETLGQSEAARRGEILHRLQQVADGSADAETWEAVRSAAREALAGL